MDEIPSDKIIVGTFGDRAKARGEEVPTSKPDGANILEFSEDALATLFTERHADNLRYIAEFGKWLRWTGTHWREEKTYLVFDLAREICHAAAIKKGNGNAPTIASAHTVAAIERLARADRRHASVSEDWDADIMALSTPGALAPLKRDQEKTTMHIRPNDPLDYCTKITGTIIGEAGAPCPMWLEFLNIVMGGDQDIIAYLQRVCGYCLTGSIKEHALFFLYGTGGNGKGVFINTIRGIMGTYHTTAPIDTFTITNSTSHPTDLAGLRGARLVTAVETEEGRRWSESKTKALTGGDEISARFMRQDFFTFTPTFKLMIAGNHKPRIRTVDEAMRRRIQMIPFNVTIPAEKRDVDFGEKLKVEWPAILRWMVNGCLEWQRIGLAPPRAVLDATEQYLQAEDIIETWIADSCEIGKSKEAASAMLFASFKSWAEQSGEWPGTQRGLIDKLLLRPGIERRPDGRKRGLLGIGLKTEPEQSFSYERDI